MSVCAEPSAAKPREERKQGASKLHVFIHLHSVSPAALVVQHTTLAEFPCIHSPDRGLNAREQAVE